MATYNFDGINKKVDILSPTIEFDAVDMYSEYKRWLGVSDNSKYLIAMKSIGGNPLSGSKNIASYIELINGWKIHTYAGDYTLTVIGNIFTEDGIPFVIPTGSAIMVLLESTSNALTITKTIGYTPDIDPPIWVNSQGIVTVSQENNYINCLWGTANDAESLVTYNVYISDDINSIWSSKLSNVLSTNMKIFTDVSGNLLETKGYYIGIKAIDESGNETTNTNYLQVDFDSTIVPLTPTSIWEYNLTTKDFADNGITQQTKDEFVNTVNTILAN